MTLQETINQMVAEFESQAPEQVLAVMHRATRDLVNSGQAAKAVKKGEMLPEFSLKDQNGALVSSKALLEKGPLVVSFYRGVW